MIRVRNRNKQHSKWLDAKSLAGAAGRSFEAFELLAEACFLGTSAGFWEALFIKSM
jgi:hypothetical protein